MLMQHSLQSNFRIPNIFLLHTSVFFAHSILASFSTTLCVLCILCRCVRMKLYRIEIRIRWKNIKGDCSVSIH